jgi:hypothetical protein
MLNSYGGGAVRPPPHCPSGRTIPCLLSVTLFEPLAATPSNWRERFSQNTTIMQNRIKLICSSVLYHTDVFTAYNPKVSWLWRTAKLMFFRRPLLFICVIIFNTTKTYIKILVLQMSKCRVYLARNYRYPVHSDIYVQVKLKAICPPHKLQYIQLQMVGGGICLFSLHFPELGTHTN